MDNLNVLGAARVNTVMSALQDVRGKSQKLLYLSRTPVVPATDGEIMAQFIGHVLIADLIADGQRAATYSAGKLSLVSNSVPNLKIGQNLTQEQLNQLNAFVEGGAANQSDMFLTTEAGILDNLNTGVEQRMEALLVASRIGGFSYDRLGIKMSGVTFGMPSDLQITISTPWTDTAAATPVTDVLTTLRIASTKYGITYNRMTMTLAAFNAMTATSEFISRARVFLAPNVSFSNLGVQNTNYMRGLAGSVLGLEIELYDARYWGENTDGSIVSAPFQPINKVVLEDSGNDNDANVIDFGNGVVTESIISKFGALGEGNVLPQNARGPVAYATSEHNPPSTTYWGVARGFPRRKMLQASACLTIAPDTGTGSINETIGFGEIAFV